MTGRGVAQVDTRTRAGGCTHIIVTAGIVGLQSAPVAEESKHHAYAAGVIDAIPSDGVGQRECLQTSCLECPGRGHVDVPIKHRIGAGADSRPGITDKA